MSEQIADEPVNHTLFTPLGTNAPRKETNPPTILSSIMKRYDKKLAQQGDYSNVKDEVLTNPAKLGYEAYARKRLTAFIKSEKDYLQSKIDELLSKQ